ncbi:phage tail tape measure protein [Listeria rocourtiae]|uniref:phage tail tape measure protein n=1 Tax=Listeria rocourtiae TaxID=647910 RepID=UPI003D2F912C
MSGNTPLGKMIVEMDLQSSKFTSSLTAVKRSLKNSESQMRAQMAVFDNADNKLGKLEAQYNGLNRSLQINKKHVDNLTKAYKEEVEANGEASVRAQNLARDINNTVSKQANLERQLKATGAAMKVEKLDLEELNNKMQANSRHTSALAQQQSLAGNKMGAMRTQYAGLGQKITDLTRIREAERQKLETIASVSGKTSSAYVNQKARIAELDNQIKINSNTMDSYAKKIGGLSPRFDEFRNQLENNASRFKNVGDKAWEAGKTVTTRFSAPLAVGLGVAIKKAADFEAQMDSVQAVSGATGSEMTKLQDLAVQLGADTKYSAQEAAMGIEELIKAGLSTTDVLNGGLAGALDLATAGEIDLASAAEIASTALNAFRDDNLSVADAANILAGGANASATDVEGLRLGLQQASAVASGAGLSFEDTATALSVFAQNGLKGSDSGTSLKTMLMRLHPQTDAAAGEFERLGLLTTNTENAMKTLKENGIKPLSGEQGILMEQMHDLAKSMAGPKASTAKVNKEFNKLLMNSGSLQSAFYDANGDLRSMSEIADILQKSLKGMSSEQRSAALNTMFGSDAIRAGNILYKEGAKGIKDMNKEMSKVTAAEVAKKKMDNLKGAVEELKGAAETLAITTGQTLIPMFTDVVKHAQQMLDKFNNLNPGVQKFITQMALAGAVAGPAIMAFGGLNRGLGSMISVIDKSVGGFSVMKLAMQNTKSGVSELSSGVGQANRPFSIVTKSATTFGKGLGLLTNPIGLTVLGVGGIGLALYGLKKAYDNSRTDIDLWGTNVPKRTAKVLEGVQNLNNRATGEFQLMSQGISGSSSAMIEDFSRMGASIENDLKSRIEGLNEALKLVPGYAKEAVGAVLSDEEKRLQGALKKVEDNNRRVSEIKKQAKDNDYKMTLEQSKRIKDLEMQNAKEYVNITVDNKKDREALLSAMTADVTSATEEQAKSWATGLAKQRQIIGTEAAKSREEFKKSLLDNGVKEGSDVWVKSLKAMEEGSKNAVSSIDQQIALIVQKYPEIAKTVFLANGQVIDSSQETSSAMIAENQKIIDSARKVAESSISMTQSLQFVGNESNKAGALWNKMVFDEKTGKVSTNALEKVVEASKQEGVWNKLNFMSKNGLLSTNVSKILDEAKQKKLTGWDAIEYATKHADIDSNEKEMLKSILKNKNQNWNPLEYFKKHADIDTNAYDIMQLVKVAKSQGWDTIPNYSKKDWEIFTNALQIKSELQSAIRDWNAIPQRDQKVLEFSYKTNGKAPSGSLAFNAKGTNFHPGGDMVVNDAPGSKFKELVTYPNGFSFIPEGRNVLLPNVPRGSSVLRGDKTAKIIPRYAKGTKKSVIPKNTLQSMSSKFNVDIQPLMVNIQYSKDSNKLNTELKNLISKLTKESQNRKSKNVSNLSVNNAKRYVENEYKKLQTLIKKRDTLIQKIKSGNEKLKELQQQSNDYAKGITDSAKSYTSITSLDKDGFDTKYMQQGMTERLKNLNEFNANLEKLKKMGVNKTTLSEIMEAGVEGGASYAKALAGSDKKTIQSLNSLQSQINTASSRLGNNSANYMYKAGIDSAKGLVKGLESQQKALENASKKMANTIVNTTKKTLKIKSPSRRFRDEVGKMVPAGYIAGVESMKGKVTKTMSNLISVPSIEIPPIREGSLLMTSIKSALNAPGENKTIQPVDNNGVIEQLVASNKQQGEMIQLLKALLSKDLIVDDKALERSNTKIQNRQLRNDLHSLGGSI